MKIFKEFLRALHDTLLITGLFSVFIAMLFVIAENSIYLVEPIRNLSE